MKSIGLSHAKRQALALDPKAVRFTAPVKCAECGTSDRYVNSLKCCECDKVHRRVDKPQRRVKLSNENLEDIIYMSEHDKLSTTDIAERFGVYRQTIWLFLTKKSHAHFYKDRGVSTTDIADMQNRALQLMNIKRV